MDSTEYVYHGSFCAIEIEGCMVVDAAPMFKWMVGKQLVEAERWPYVFSCILCSVPDGNDETSLAEQIEIASRMTD